MKSLIFLTIFLVLFLNSQELKIEAKLFTANEKDGISIFEGDVKIIKGTDEVNASKVTIYTDENKKPTKFMATGCVSFNITVHNGDVYSGKAGKIIYVPADKEYHFFENVHLKQMNEKKEIIGEEVVLNLEEGNAYAKGAKTEPIIMILNIPEKEKK